MGTSKFFIESKYFEFILDSGGSFFMLWVVERDKGYYQLIILGRDEAFWLLLIVDDDSRLENDLGYLRESREPQRALRGQWCNNFLGRYMAIKEFNDGGRVRFILILEGKNSWGWCGFVETLQKLLSPLTSMKCNPPAVVIPWLELRPVTANCSYVQMVAGQGMPTNLNGTGFRVITVMTY